MEQDLREQDENRFRIDQLVIDALLVDIRHACHTHGNSAQNRHEHPAHADITRRRNVLERADRHEAHDDVRLAEIPKPPAGGGNDSDHREALEPTEEVHAARRVGNARGRRRQHFSMRCIKPTDGTDRNDRHQNERHEHDTALHKVSQADRQEPAEQCIRNHNTSRHEQAERVIKPERRFEQLAASHDAG